MADLEWDRENYTNLLWNAKAFIRHSADLYVQSHSAPPEQAAKLRARAFKTFIDAQRLAERAHVAAYGRHCPLLLPQLDQEIEALTKDQSP